MNRVESYWLLITYFSILHTSAQSWKEWKEIIGDLSFLKQWLEVGKAQIRVPCQQYSYTSTAKNKAAVPELKPALRTLRMDYTGALLQEKRLELRYVVNHSASGQAPGIDGLSAGVSGIFLDDVYASSGMFQRRDLLLLSVIKHYLLETWPSLRTGGQLPSSVQTIRCIPDLIDAYWACSVFVEHTTDDTPGSWAGLKEWRWAKFFGTDDSLKGSWWSLYKLQAEKWTTNPQWTVGHCVVISISCKGILKKKGTWSRGLSLLHQHWKAVSSRVTSASVGSCQAIARWLLRCAVQLLGPC